MGMVFSIKFYLQKQAASQIWLMGYGLPTTNIDGRGELKRVGKGVGWGWLWLWASFPGLGVVCMCREHTTNNFQFPPWERGLSSLSKWGSMVIKDLEEDGNDLEKIFEGNERAGWQRQYPTGYEN